VALEGDRVEYSLKRCVEMGRLDTVQYAIQHGANPRGRTLMYHPHDNTPIRVACERGHIAIAELLLELGADPKVAIAAAADRGQTELVDRLLKAGIAPVGALPKAAAGGYLDVVRLLLDAGVDANEVVGSKSPNPLASAISREHTAMFELLIDRGADVHAAGVAEECVQRARKDGLESMLLLLRGHGVSIEE
jgi:ankyrin repeat protein